MDKELLQGAFKRGEIPEYKCPHCHKGVLREEGELRAVETEASKGKRREAWWEPEMIEGVFSLTLQCSKCSELVLALGSTFVDQSVDLDDEGELSMVYFEFLKPAYFQPSLRLIDYPAKTPKEVVASLNVAGSLYFSSSPSCCNQIRIAAENILTYLGIPEKDGESFIPFGKRIQQLPDDQKSVKALFSAIRWLGNHSSHPSAEIQPGTALHALEMTEFLLEEIFGERRAALEKLADAINESKGPVGRLH